MSASVRHSGSMEMLDVCTTGSERAAEPVSSQNETGCSSDVLRLEPQRSEVSLAEARSSSVPRMEPRPPSETHDKHEALDPGSRRAYPASLVDAAAQKYDLADTGAEMITVPNTEFHESSVPSAEVNASDGSASDSLGPPPEVNVAGNSRSETSEISPSANPRPSVSDAAGDVHTASSPTSNVPAFPAEKSQQSSPLLQASAATSFLRPVAATESSPPRSNANRDGSLLRMFKSELFDSYFHMYYLFHRPEQGIHDYLTNRLYLLPEEDIHFYLPQLCCLCITRHKTSNLHRFILEKASKSMHLALKSCWLFQSCMGEASAELNEISNQLNQDVEMAVVNSKPVPPGSSVYCASQDVEVPDLFERRRAVRKLHTSQQAATRTKATRTVVTVIAPFSSSAPVSPGEDSGQQTEVAPTSSAVSLPPTGDMLLSMSGQNGPDKSAALVLNDGSSGPVSPEGGGVASPQSTQDVLCPSQSQQPQVDDSSQPASSVAVPDGGTTEDDRIREVVDHSANLNSREPSIDMTDGDGKSMIPDVDVNFQTETSTTSETLSKQDANPSGTKETPSLNQPSPSGRVPHQKVRVTRGFVSRTRESAVAGGRITLPSVYEKLQPPFQFPTFRDAALMDWDMQPHIVKQRRCDYFNLTNTFISTIIDVSNRLSQEPDRSLRLPLLQKFLHAVNEWMFCRRCIVAASEGIFQMTGLNIPLSEFGSLGPSGPNSHSTQIVRFIPEECRVLSSKKRAPYLLVFEVADLDEDLRQLPPIFRLGTYDFSAGLASGGLRFKAAESENKDRSHSTEALDIQAPLEFRARRKSTNICWDHLYLYACIVKELEERNLYAAPAVGPDACPETPLETLRRSMGLRNRRGSSGKGVSNEAVLSKSQPDSSPKTSENVSYKSPHSHEAESEPDLSPNQNVHDPASAIESDPAVSTVGDVPVPDPPADVCAALENERVVEGTAANGMLWAEPRADASAPPVEEDHIATDIPVCQSKPEEDSLTSLQQLTPEIPVVEGDNIVTMMTTAAAPPEPAIPSTMVPGTRRGVVATMTQLHAPTIPPAGQSRRRSFHAGGTRRGRSPAPQTSASRSHSGSRTDDRARSGGPRPASGSSSIFPVSSYSALSSVWGLASGVMGSKPETRKSDVSASSPGLPKPRPSQSAAVETKVGTSESDGVAQVEGKVGQSVLSSIPSPAELAANAKALRHKLWGDLWHEKKERWRKVSPYGVLKSWNLGCVLVKGGDDVRQEMLASQLIRQFKWIFEQAGLPLYVRPYEILVTGANSGIMVFVPDTMSVDTLKKKFGTDSISKVYEAAFADNPYEAKKNFILSHSAYSIIGYLLQVKDRHNGNYLVDAEGHLIHIDYGYMLSNSPGNVNFESSPFKLTSEFMGIMDGESSENYEYFRTLVVRGFIEARKHAERLFLLVEMMASTKMPCFAAGPEATVAALRDRFMMNVTEEVCISKIVDLLDISVNNWRTIQYDNFQRITNGIQ